MSDSDDDVGSEEGQAMSDFKAVEVQAISNIMGCLAHIVVKPPELWDSAGVENVLQLAAAEISKLLALGLRQRTDIERLTLENAQLAVAQAARPLHQAEEAHIMTDTEREDELLCAAIWALRAMTDRGEYWASEDDTDAIMPNDAIAAVERARMAFDEPKP